MRVYTLHESFDTYIPNVYLGEVNTTIVEFGDTLPVDTSKIVHISNILKYSCTSKITGISFPVKLHGI